MPTTLLRELELEPSPNWPPGIYLFGGDVLRVGIVVASKLPRERSTLFLRLMAAGPLLPPAALEVAALPADAYERLVAEPVLVKFEGMIRKAPDRTPDEQEFMMAMAKTWEDKRNEGLAEGQARGLAEGQARSVLTVLHARGVTVPDAARERILAQTDRAVLQRWLERATVASSADEVLDER